MHSQWLIGLLTGFALIISSRAAEPATKSELEIDPEKWTDLLADKDLKSWKRVPIPADANLHEVNPWKMNAMTGTLLCKGKGAGHEMLLFNHPEKNGIFHVEWRFSRVEGGKGYNSGVYVRNSADGKVWHQAQVGDRNVGYIFGNTLVDGKPKRFNTGQKGTQRGKPAGEWNTYEITCKDKSIKLWINGFVTAELKDCQVPKGYVGLEAEGWDIEFRNVKFKTLE